MVHSVDERQDDARWNRVALGLLLLVALLVRGGALLALGSRFQEDPDAYANLARGVREHGVLGFVHEGRTPRPTALRPPLYPVILAPTILGDRPWSIAVGVLHVLLGVGTVLLVERLGLEWQLGRWRWLAAMLTAVDPLLLNQSTLIMSETPATFLATATLLALTKLGQQPSLFGAAASGMLLGLAMLCRPTFAPWAALIVPGCLLLPVPNSRRLIAATVLLAGISVVLAPWIVRNQIYLGRPIIATTHGGYTLLLGNNPHFYDYLRSGQSDQSDQSDQSGQSAGRWDAKELHNGYRAEGHRSVTWDPKPALEVQRDRVDARLAWQAIRRQPAMFVTAAAVRLGRLWSPLPLQRSTDESTARRLLRYATAAWYLALYASCGLGLVKLGRRACRFPWLWGLSLCLVFSVVHLFYWSDLRMRAPLVPVIALLAAQGASGLMTFRSKPGDVT